MSSVPRQRNIIFLRFHIRVDGVANKDPTTNILFFLIENSCSTEKSV